MNKGELKKLIQKTIKYYGISEVVESIFFEILDKAEKEIFSVLAGDEPDYDILVKWFGKEDKNQPKIWFGE